MSPTSVAQRQFTSSPEAPREGLAEPLSNLLERYQYALLAVFTVLYFAGTALRARSAPFWHDEVYTLLLSHLDLGRMWAALRDGVDPTPPLTDILVRAVNSVWGEGNIVSRIPAMVGFWVFCLCLYTFVRRRLNTAYALSAMLLPFSTTLYSYAIQARCYGIVLGLSGIALVSWQLAVETRQRSAFVFLAVSLMAAIFSHYYAVMLLAPLVGGQLWRDWRRRSLDLPVWCAIAVGGGAGILLCLPLVRATQRFMSHPYGVPHPRLLFDFYPTALQPMIAVAVLFLLLTAVWLLFEKNDLSPSKGFAVPEHEIAAASICLVVPIAGYVIAELVTKMFNSRYFLIATAGVILMIVFAIAKWSRGSHAPGILLLLAATPSAAWMIAHHLPQTPVIDSEPLLHAAVDEGPVIMDDGIHYLEQWYYLPTAQKSKLAYVEDPESDAKWVGHDMIDIGMEGLRKWFAVPALRYKEVHTPGNVFRVYHNSSGPNWLLNRLLQDGVRIELVQSSGDRALFRATVPLQAR